MDTPGAALDKKLTIRGVAGGVIHAKVTFSSFTKASLAVFPGASGSEIINVAMEGSTGIVSLGQTVDHVTVRGCRIDAADAAILLFAMGSSGWNIEHNTIRMENRLDTQMGFAAGVSLSFQHDARVAHNEISGVLPKGGFMSASGVTGLGAFDHFDDPSPTAAGLAIAGNLSSASSHRGEGLSRSDYPIGHLLMP